MDCSGPGQRPVLPGVTDSGVGEGGTGGDAGGGRAGVTEGDGGAETGGGRAGETEGDGGAETGGGRPGEAGGSQNGRSKQIDDLFKRLGLDVNFQNKLTKGCFLEISSSSIQNKESKTEKDLVHSFMQRLLTLDYTAKHLSVKTEGPVPKSKHTAGKGSFVAFLKKNAGNKENKPTHVHPMDVQMAVFFCADPFLQQIMVTKLSQCQYAVPLLVPNPFTENTEFPLWTMRQISKSWKTMDTSGRVTSKTLPMYKAQTPVVTFFRIGSISSSKSQLMNRLINEKHDTFFHRDCPGSSRERLLMDGVVEIAWYLPSGKITDHFSDCVAFCNLHGDSSINETQRKILTEMSSVNVVLLPQLDENDNNMVIVQELFESSKPLIIVLTDEDDEGEDDVCEIEEGKFRVSLKGRNQSDVSVCLRGVIKNCLSEQAVTFSLEKIAEHSEKTEENTEKTEENTEKTEENTEETEENTEETEENTEETEENTEETEENTEETEENTEKTEENTEETEEHTEMTEEHTEETEEHTEETEENTEETEENTEETEEHTEETEEHTEETEEHTEETEENTEETEENTEETEENTEETEEHTEKTEENTEKTEEHTEETEENTEETEENTEETEENTEETEEHTEKTEENTEKTEEHTEETEENTEETEEHTEKTEENTEETEENTEKTEHTGKTEENTEETEENTEKTEEHTEETEENTEETEENTEKTEHTGKTEENTEETEENTEETEENTEKTEENTENTEENTEKTEENTEETEENTEKTEHTGKTEENTEKTEENTEETEENTEKTEHTGKTEENTEKTEENTEETEENTEKTEENTEKTEENTENTEENTEKTEENTEETEENTEKTEHTGKTEENTEETEENTEKTEHTGKTEENTEKTEENTEETEENTEKTEENTEETEENTEETEENTEKTEENTEETEEHTEETEENTEKTEENTEETEENTEETEEHTEKTEEHTEETEEHTEKTEEHTEETEENTEETEEHTEKTEENTEETEENTEETEENTEETEENKEETEENTEETEENTEKTEHTGKTEENTDKTEEHRELKVDEENEDCQRGKEAAQEMMRFLERKDPSTVKEKYLPCHGKLWHDWSQNNKDLRRLKSENIESEKSEKENKLTEIRKKQQNHGFSELMKLFVGSLRSLSDTEKMYFLKWTTILLDDFTLHILSNILQEYDQKWSDVLALKRTHNKENETLQKMKSEQLNLEKISNKLNAATFGLEHMLREMGQIHEASVSERREDRVKDGDLSYLPELAAELMISGHPMELMDGDAAHVPLVWVSAVLDKVIRKLGDQRVFVLSVLGIQSSGKSTMLNAMFGLQFAVSAGRCTRGAFMQLVKVSEEMKEELKFDYILVVDTEGLRALELAGTDTLHHDNELATFVVGLGNMTLINIFGENPSEMQDILQIVVQAFMRMKKVRLNPSCVFVHQNVTDVAAGEKNMDGRRRLQEKLDEMTRLAAKDEVCDAECFSDIIAFNVQKDVKYFSQLWEGSPPMAPPNPRYSENVQDLKRDIVSRASKTNCMKLSQFQQRVKDLWEALLNENFVFSFRNTLEISVYRKLEVEYEKWTWSLRSAMLSIEDKILNRISSGKVEAVEKQELMREMSETLQEVQTAFKEYFEEDSEKETLIQWKTRFEKQIQHLHDDLVDEAKRKLDENIKQKNILKNLDDKLINHENTLFEKSKELALDLKENESQNRDPKAQFDSVWGNWVTELTNDVPEIKDVNIPEDVLKILEESYEYGLIFNQKKRAGYIKIHTVADYSSYVSMKRVKLGPVPLWEKSLKPEDQTLIRQLISKVIQQTTEKVNSFPVSVQGYSSGYIHVIVRDVKQRVQEFKPRHDSFEFKKEFFVDLSLYVCEQAEKRFVELHRKYREANDPILHFKKKKDDYFKVFMKYYQGATSAAVLGDQICVKLKEAILQSVYNMIAKFICDQMRGKPPFNGNRGDLEKHILKSLAEQEGDKEEKFNNFLTYMNQPKIHFENFIRDRVRQYMAAENPQAASVIKEHINHKQIIVISGAEAAKDEVKSIKGDVNKWLEIFSNSLVDDLGDTKVHLSDKVTKDVTDYDVLVDVIKKELLVVVEELKGSFCKLSDLRKEMFREKPEEILIKHFCRCCWNQCPFCGAVCTNSQEDHTGDHQAEYHRSGGMKGWHYRGTREFSIDFCTTKVASDRSFYPDFSESSVPYNKYRTAGGDYAKWMISTDSQLTYWKWFVCEFKENLENDHKLYFSGRGKILPEWKNFSQSDAVASLGISK